MEGWLNFIGNILSSGLVIFFVQRHYAKKDAELLKKQQEILEKQKIDDKLKNKIENGLETLRLLSYTRISHEVERLKQKGYATLQDRAFLKELYENYKSHGWNGDMEAGMQDVRELPTNPPQNKANNGDINV